MAAASAAQMGKGVVGRMAPTPSSSLHIGNLFASLVAWLAAKSRGGRILLRIEDVDRDRSRQEHIDGIFRDLEALGLYWDNEEIVYQSSRTDAYDAAMERLKAQRAVYPCFCSRADLHAASAPHVGEHFVYAGTCRNLTPERITELRAHRSPAMRLHVPDAEICVDDAIQGPYCQNLACECGDYIVRRSDGIYAYQLAVVVDDLAQGVNQVVRGYDLLECAPQQEFLRHLLDADAPEVEYAHVPLLLDTQGRRLAKRDRDMGLPGLLDVFGDVPHLIGYLAALTGLRDDAEPITVQELIGEFSFERLRGKQSITWALPR